jgi:hypothetical protein
VLKIFLSVCCLVLIFVVSGCGKKAPEKLKVYPVSGKVSYNGKAPVKALLTFHPVAPLNEPTKKMVVPTAQVGADGTFKVGFYTESDGAPIGEYAITVSWPTFKIEGGEEIAGPDRLQNRYDDKQRPAAKFTVKEGENKIPDINLR